MLTGNKIKLVPVTDHNLRELYEMWNDPEVGGEFGGFEKMSWDQFREKFVKGASWFLIEKISDPAIIGWINFFRTRTDYPRLWEIGYALMPSERKLGYMTEAAKLIVEYLFSTKDIDRVEALTDLENVPSQGVLEKAGFKREGLLRKRSFKNGVHHDEYMYSILREDWQKSKSP